MLKTLLSITFGIFIYSVSAQEVLTLKPSSNTGKDAEVFSLDPDRNLDEDGLRGAGWTFGGLPGIIRGLIEFDLSTIPTGSKVDSAFLSLYSPASPSTQTHSGSNSAFLRRITSYWGENEVTWNIQPSVTENSRVILPASSSEYQNYTNINVTKMVNDMVNDPANSFGFMLSLQDETPFNRLSFVSSNHAEGARHPKLVVYYTPTTCNTIVLQPGDEGKDAEIFSLQPTTNLNGETYRGAAWTFSGDNGVVRGLLEFDLSVIPANAEITSAYLTLSSPEGGHSQWHAGNNSGWLQRITSSWTENTVTWGNQPSTTSNNQVSLAESTLEFQDYRNIDVTDLVRDMREDPANSFGFMLMLKSESIFRRMSFASSDYFNETKHPRLEICYTPSVAIKPDPQLELNATIAPNPFHNWVEINGKTNGSSIRLQIFTSFGTQVYDQVVPIQTRIDLPELTPNMYIFKLTDELSGSHSFKLIKH